MFVRYVYCCVATYYYCRTNGIASIIIAYSATSDEPTVQIKKYGTSHQISGEKFSKNCPRFSHLARTLEVLSEIIKLSSLRLHTQLVMPNHWLVTQRMNMR